jgi:hypothetical protein
MAEASVLDRPNIHRTRVGLKVPEVTPNVGSSREELKKAAGQYPAASRAQNRLFSKGG